MMVDAVTRARGLALHRARRAARLARAVEETRALLRVLPSYSPEWARVVAELERRSILADACHHLAGGDREACRDLMERWLPAARRRHRLLCGMGAGS